MFDKEMARIRDALAVGKVASVTELSDKVSQVSTTLADSSSHGPPSEPSSGR